MGLAARLCIAPITGAWIETLKIMAHYVTLMLRTHHGCVVSSVKKYMPILAAQEKIPLRIFSEKRNDIILLRKITDFPLRRAEHSPNVQTTLVSHHGYMD